MRREFFVLANGSEMQRSSATLNGTTGRQSGKDASRWRRRAWDAHHFAKEEGSSHPQTRRALQALVCLQRSCFAASSAFREVPKKKGVVSLKRGNSFLVQKKHSDYENPNACGRM